jgi:DNA-binding winged helix-turn-helix (wHTH) protein/tetratricopeptide (TPR) repeat protein
VVIVSATQKLLRFGVYELNLATEELRKDGIPLKLSPQPFRILTLLASRAGQIVAREEIEKQIWGDETYVDFEHGLNQCIKQIRTALNDNADTPLYVETLPRRGYRFLAPVVSKTVEAPGPQVTESRSGIQSAITPPTTPQAGDSAPTSGSSASRDRVAVLNPESVPAVAPPTSAPTTVAAELAVEPAPARESGHRVVRSRLTWAAVVVAVLTSAGVYWRSTKASALTEKDSIVLADFTNSTNDRVFDGTLRRGLAIQLEQSPFLNVLSDHKVDATLKLMNRPPDERLTQEVAREVCLRTEAKALVAGSIASVGDHYLIGLKAMNCQSEDTLASAEAEAENRNKVLKALGNAGDQLREKLGESLASVKRFDQPLEEATTSSLEALQAFTRAQQIRMTGGGADAIPDLKRALELDPNFAYAYASLGNAYSNHLETSLAIDNLKKAYELRDRVSQRERFNIETQYYIGVTGELDKAIQTSTAWSLSYPGDYTPHNIMGGLYARLGQYEKTAAETRESIRLAPADVDYSNLLGIYVVLDQLNEAHATFDQALARNQDGPFLREYRYYLAFLQGDNAVMQKQLAWAAGKPGVGDMLLSMQSDTEAYYGALSRAREFSGQAAESARHADAPETAAVWRANEALREVEIGDAGRARKRTAEALALSTGRSPTVMAALTLARIGEAAQAQRLAEKLDQEFPLDTIIQGYWLPTIRAAIELDRGNSQQAIVALQSASTYELGTPPPFLVGPMYPIYMRGLAYLRAGEGQQAAAEFRKIIAHPGITLNFVTGALAHLQLGRAQAMMGDKEPARKSYQDFLALWKDSDPDIPVYKQAEAEYAMLR